MFACINLAFKKQRELDEELRVFLPYVSATQPFPDDSTMTASQCNSLLDRWRLYRKWVKKAKEHLQNKIELSQREYAETVKQLGELRSIGDVSILKAAKVIPTHGMRHKRKNHFDEPYSS